MAQYDITASGNLLLIDLIVTDSDFTPTGNSFFSPSIRLSNDKIKFFESGQYVMALNFNQINEIATVAPTTILDAYSKINTLIAALAPTVTP